MIYNCYENNWKIKKISQNKTTIMIGEINGKIYTLRPTDENDTIDVYDPCSNNWHSVGELVSNRS